MVLDLILKTLFKDFVKKWSKHKCSNPFCSFTITIDGNWKISRIKCACCGFGINSKEFGFIETGCLFTPERKNYYCSIPSHSNQNLIFKHGYNEKGKPKFLSVLPKFIKWTRLCK